MKPKITATNVETGNKFVIRDKFCPPFADQHVALKNFLFVGPVHHVALGSAIVFAAGAAL